MGHLSSYLSTAAPDQWLHELAVLVCVKKAGVNQIGLSDSGDL